MQVRVQNLAQIGLLPPAAAMLWLSCRCSGTGPTRLLSKLPKRDGSKTGHLTHRHTTQAASDGSVSYLQMSTALKVTSLLIPSSTLQVCRHVQQQASAVRRGKAFGCEALGNTPDNSSPSDRPQAGCPGGVQHHEAGHAGQIQAIWGLPCSLLLAYSVWFGEHCTSWQSCNP